MQESSVRQRYHPFTNVSQWRDTHWGIGGLSEHHAMGMIISDIDWVFAVCQAAQPPQSLTPAPDVDFPFTLREVLQPASQHSHLLSGASISQDVRTCTAASVISVHPSKGSEEVSKPPSFRQGEAWEAICLASFLQKGLSLFPQAPFRFSSEYMLLSEMILCLGLLLCVASTSARPFLSYALHPSHA